MPQARRLVSDTARGGGSGCGRFEEALSCRWRPPRDHVMSCTLIRSVSIPYPTPFDADVALTQDMLFQQGRNVVKDEARDIDMSQSLLHGSATVCNDLDHFFHKSM